MKYKILLLTLSFFLIPNHKEIYPQAGLLDTTFGQAGVVTNSVNLFKLDSYARALALQSDGKVVAAGFSGNISNTDFTIARFDKNGNLDNTFGISGKVITSIGSSRSGIADIAIQQKDNKIVATGYSFSGEFTQFTTVRYNTDGSLDNSFGNNGVVITHINNFFSAPNSLVLQNDGKILVGGYIGTTKFDNGDIDFAIVRYNSDGSLDNTFGTNGIVTSPSGSDENVRNLAVQIDGKIVAVNSIIFSNKYFIKITRLNSNGSLDNTFGVNGIITDFNYPSSISRTVTIQNDGKIIVAGYSFNNPGNYNCILIRYNADGSIDNSFGINGAVIDSIGNKGSTICSLKLKNDGSIEALGFSINDFICDLDVINYNANGILDSTFGVNGVVTMPTEYDPTTLPPVFNYAVKQSNGKIVTSGNIFNGINNNIVLYRFNTNGSLDETFGTRGISYAVFGNSKSYINSAVIQTNQNNERIVTAGQSWNGSNFDFALSRYNSDGSLDNAFGINGSITNTIGSSDAFANSINAQSDGKIVATGSSNDGNKKVFTTARYNTDGSLDNTFGTGGIVTTPIGTLDSYANSIAVQKDGKIITAGVSPSSFGIGITNHVFTLIRYNSDGTLDSDFGTNGIATKRVGTLYSEATSIEIQDNGKILAGGFSGTGGKVFALVRLNPDGKSDTTFSNDGIVSTSIGKIEGQALNSSISAINSLSIQKDGKIIACGYCTNGESGSAIAKDFALVRYNTDGSLDSTFGEGGIIISSLGDWDDIAYSVKVQDDGKIIAGGYTESGNDEDFVLVRYNSNGSLDSTFGTNGIMVNNFGSAGNFIKSILIQKDGNIIAAGYSANEDSSEVVNILVRYLGNNQTASIAENKLEKIRSFNLLQNYPNPFNPNTVISWEQPFSGHVSLRVYDILGREVSTLVNEEKEAGNYRATFDAKNLASGVYIYKLSIGFVGKSGNFIQTRKMVLIR